MTQHGIKSPEVQLQGAKLKCCVIGYWRLLLGVAYALSTTFFSNGQPHPLQAFPLKSVQLLPSPFKQAEQVNAEYILALDADRLLAPFLQDAGIKPVKPKYGNWESDGLDGHTLGHYLSALAQMQATSKQPVYAQRMEYVLEWLEKCQQANGNGYVDGVPGGKAVWAGIAQADLTEMNKRWVPWYNIHKTYAGLIDAWRLTGNEKAKRILISLSEWAYRLTQNLSDEKMQQMLDMEYGGMNEAFADVAAITGDQRFLYLANRFSHRRLLNPLLQQKDSLTGLHANTQIPKVIGFIRYATQANDAQWARAADFFWNTVVSHRTISIGGNSVREHFNAPNDYSPMVDSREGPENCNSYNMLKLTKQLFLDKPAAKYMDYYERTIYNHILSSQHPQGGFVYFTPIHPQHYRVYSQPQETFWCCVGTGIENHGKYGELIYSHNDQSLYVNLFIPSKLHWSQKRVEVTQTTRFPYEEASTLTINTPNPQALVIKIRKPGWAGKQFGVVVNGKPQPLTMGSDGYVLINRVWKNGDVIKVLLPMVTTLENLPDNSNYTSFVHGPIVLAAVTSTDTSTMPGLRAVGSRWGHIAGGPLWPVNQAPLLVMPASTKQMKLKPINKQKLIFSVADLVYQPAFKNLTLVPFYQVHDARYMLYWPYTTRQQLPALQKRMKEEEAAKQQLEMATIDKVYPGEQQPEADHFMKQEGTRPGFFREKRYRTGNGWFSYQLRNAGKEARSVSFVYYGLENGKTFNIWANNTLLATIQLQGNEGAQFITKRISLPEALLQEAELTIKFEGKPTIGSIYELRLLK